MSEGAKGLCFNCDEKFHKGHIYKSKLFAFMLINNESNAMANGALEDDLTREVWEKPEINFNTLTSQHTP